MCFRTINAVGRERWGVAICATTPLLILWYDESGWCDDGTFGKYQRVKLWIMVLNFIAVVIYVLVMRFLTCEWLSQHTSFNCPIRE